MISFLNRIYCRIIHGLMRPVVRIIKFPEQQIISGAGSLIQLASVIKKKDIDVVAVITDATLMKLNLLQPLINGLEKENIKYLVYDGVMPNPTIQSVEEGLKLYNKNSCQCVIGFGGGSSIDCAKIVAARASNPNQYVKQMRGLFKIKKPTVPLITIPTTAGTGSETTIAAVITDTETHAKFAVTDKKLMPSIVVMDPDLTIGLPSHITSTTGMDALTHAVEAYIGLHGTPFVNKNAEDAVRLIFANLEDVYKDGSLKDARNNMLWASYYGGAAFTRASIGYVHAIAHNMGGLYGVPHGLANAIILPYVLEFSRKNCKKKLAKLTIVGGIGSEKESTDKLSIKFIEHIKRMNANMNIPQTIKELQEKDIPLIVERALKEANPAYPVPRILNRKQCETLIRKLLP
jgi:alcohol dehydrogenase class IV